MICKQRGLWTAVWCEEAQIRACIYVDGVHCIPYHREQWNVYNFADYIVGCLRVCMSSLCCMLFQIHWVHNSDTTIQEIHGSLIGGSCKYIYIYIAIWWKHLLVCATCFQKYILISHVGTLVAKKKSHHDYWVALVYTLVHRS